jgi:hypothetical protein
MFFIGNTGPLLKLAGADKFRLDSPMPITVVNRFLRNSLECADLSALWSAVTRRRIVESTQASMAATGRDRPKRRQVSALQKSLSDAKTKSLPRLSLGSDAEKVVLLKLATGLRTADNQIVIRICAEKLDQYSKL